MLATFDAKTSCRDWAKFNHCSTTGIADEANISLITTTISSLGDRGMHGPCRATAPGPRRGAVRGAQPITPSGDARHRRGCNPKQSVKL
jgi:hypothetical protein